MSKFSDAWIADVAAAEHTFGKQTDLYFKAPLEIDERMLSLHRSHASLLGDSVTFVVI